MAKQYWVVKSEPAAYSWQDFVRDGKAAWTGVRNFQARNHLRAMKRGDLVFFYHSVSEKQVLGVAEVAVEAYPDPTAKEGDWSAIEIVPMKALVVPVPLDTIKADPILSQIMLVRNSRLSVSSLTAAQFKRLLVLAGTRL